MATKQNVGNNGETQACEWLASHGFAILKRNLSTKFGEIDILAAKGMVMHFVEVKTRRTDGYGEGVDAITPKKLRAMCNSAIAVFNAQRIYDRFQVDVISIDAGVITYYPNVTL